MRTYTVTITGKTHLIMHNDNIAWTDQMSAWEHDPRNKGKSRAGDDRTPPFRWLGCLYHDNQKIVIPKDNVMSSFMSGGALLNTGQGKKTFKAQTQSGILMADPFWPLIVKGATIPIDPFFSNMESREWEEQNALAKKHGIVLFVKRAKIGQNKHIRVRPKFEDWAISGKLIVTDETITKAILQQIGSLAGQYVGLGDWRPKAPKAPGPYGIYEFVVE